ncbi:MAG TPA: hypothetical protein VJ752_22930 [Burkholderiaceae bacterium]|nr:hypothetical protein [Burkholderiaceae bacterium]
MHCFKQGDLVQSRLDGPEMLVVEVVDEFPFVGETAIGVYCVWEEHHLLHERVFAQHMLAAMPAATRRYNVRGQVLIPGATALPAADKGA